VIVIAIVIVIVIVIEYAPGCLPRRDVAGHLLRAKPSRAFYGSRTRAPPEAASAWAREGKSVAAFRSAETAEPILSLSRALAG
jgi:hypothetical protein